MLRFRGGLLLDFWKRHRWLTPLLSALVTAALLVPALWMVRSRAFILDDTHHFGRYASRNADRSVVEVVRLRHWQEQSLDNTWRPLPKLLWRALATPADAPSRVALTLVTITLAVLNAAALAIYLMRLFGRRWWVPLLAALPMVHPLTSDVLLPFVGQADLIASLLMILALVMWCKTGYARVALGGVLLFGASLSKESVFPAVLALPALFLLAPPQPCDGAAEDQGLASRSRGAVLVFFVASAVMMARFAAQRWLLGAWPGTTGAAGAATVADERAVGFAETVGLWAAHITGFMIPQADYSFLKQPSTAPGIMPVLGVVATVGGLIAMGFLLIPRRGKIVPTEILRLRRIAGASLLAAGLFASLFLNLLPIGAIFAGRFTLLPLILLTLPVGAVMRGVEIGVESGQTRRGWLSVTGTILTLLLLMSAVRITHRGQQWSSPQRLWEAEVLREPRHAFAWRNLAFMQREGGDVGLAWESINQAVELWPTFGEGWLSRAQIARVLGRNADAEESFARARVLLPPVATRAEEARFLASMKRFEEALPLAEEAVRLTPDDGGIVYLRDKIRADLESSRTR